MKYYEIKSRYPLNKMLNSLLFQELVPMDKILYFQDVIFTIRNNILSEFSIFEIIR